MIETVMSWIGYTPTVKYLVVMEQLRAAEHQLSMLYWVTIVYQLSLITLICWGVWKGYKLVVNKKEKTAKAEKKEETAKAEKKEETAKAEKTK